MADGSKENTDGTPFGGHVLESAWNYVKPYFTDQKSELDESDLYKFSHRRRGVALIVCNDKFEGNSNRQGAEHDLDHFQKTFRHLGFHPSDIRVRNNLSSEDLINWFVAVSREDMSDCDCLMVAISSHGDEYMYTDSKRSHVTMREDIVYSTDKVILTRDLVGIFIDKFCPTLAGKPKIFFVQACRGQQLDPGVKVDAGDMDVVDGIADLQYTVSPSPCFKDFCIVYATPPGHFAFRRPSEGSWFVKALWDVVGKLDPSEVDFQKIITRVIQTVASDYQSSSNNRMIDAKKQSGCMYSMLTKDVYFTRRPDKQEPMD